MAEYGVKTTHPEYDCYLGRWIQVDDVIGGAASVKAKTTCYLPKPNSHINECGPDKSMYVNNENGYSQAYYAWCQSVKINDQRYFQYIQRALFYNFTKRTKDGMVGSVFRKDPTYEIPTNLEYLISDCDGNGTNLDQQARVSLDQGLRKGRAGLFVDMPVNESAPSQSQTNSGANAPRIQKYEAQDIVNWRTEMFGSVNKVVMVVLREYYEDQSNFFTYELKEQYRVLKIVDGRYEQELHRFETDGKEPTVTVVDDIRANGQAMDFIPFYFIGSEENDYTVDDAPLYDLSEVNIAHYRNSADNEESSFICGQPTLVIAPSKSFGNPTQFSQANPNGVQIGSRSGINVGDGGSAQLLQAQENNLAKQNMRDKEEQAIAIGAELITPSTQQTAEAARIQKGADTSVLAAVANNVSDAYTDALRACAVFMGIGELDSIWYELNTDFFISDMTAQDRAQLVMEWQSGLIPKEYVYDQYRRHGIVPSDATKEDIDALLEEDNMNGPQGLMGDINGNEPAA